METYILNEESRIWTKRSGQGTIPVILISGGPGTENYMEPIAILLEEEFQVIQFDPAGTGRSPEGNQPYGLDEFIEDLEHIRRTHNLEKWWVVGHSWGADVALAYSLTHSNLILGVISISGTGVQNDRDWKAAYIMNKEIQGEQAPQFVYPVNQSVHRSLLESWREFIKQPDLLKRISEIRLPILFLVAEKDIRPSWPIQQLAALIPTSESKSIRGAGHYIWLTDTQELKVQIIRFIKNRTK